MKHFSIFLFCLTLLLSCKTTHLRTSKSPKTADNQSKNTTKSSLIKDCPEELINNVMPIVGKNIFNKPTSYYIYKGVRREIKEFDSVWVNRNCKVKTILAQ